VGEILAPTIFSTIVDLLLPSIVTERVVKIFLVGMTCLSTVGRPRLRFVLIGRFV
jgi:hypothetical protein